jgi:hypothetical protein
MEQDCYSQMHAAKGLAHLQASDAGLSDLHYREAGLYSAVEADMRTNSDGMVVLTREEVVDLLLGQTRLMMPKSDDCEGAHVHPHEAIDVDTMCHVKMIVLYLADCDGDNALRNSSDPAGSSWVVMVDHVENRWSPACLHPMARMSETRRVCFEQCQFYC